MTDITKQLAEALRKLLPIAKDYDDEGPMHEGWKSDTLQAWIAEGEQALAAAQSAPSEPAQGELPPLPAGWKFNHARQQTDDDGPVDGVWEIGWLEVDDNYFAPIVTVDTGLYYQDKDAEPLAKAILARLTESRAALASQPAARVAQIRGSDEH